MSTDLRATVYQLIQQVGKLENENREMKRHILLSNLYVMSSLIALGGGDHGNIVFHKARQMAMDDAQLELAWKQFKESNIDDNALFAPKPVIE